MTSPDCGLQLLVHQNSPFLFHTDRTLAVMKKRHSLTICLSILFLSLTSCASNMTSSNEPGPADPDAPTEFSGTPSGLKYKILRKSDGPKPKPSDSVLAHYRGWLDDGTEFDSSYARGEPTAFPLSGVIPGWTEGLQLIGTGGMIELEIPSELGYGQRGAGADIPPNARLHFIVELIEIR